VTRRSTPRPTGGIHQSATYDYKIHHPLPTVRENLVYGQWKRADNNGRFERAVGRTAILACRRSPQACEQQGEIQLTTGGDTLSPFLRQIVAGRHIMATGTVKWFNQSFILPENGGGRCLRPHFRRGEQAGLTILNDGQKVSFDVGQDGRGKTSAINLKAGRPPQHQ
jgi:cold shock protein